MIRLNKLVPPALLLFATGCTDTGVDATEVPLFVRGTAIEEPITVEGWQVELTDARLAFGPLYLCKGTQAGELCDTALLEWLDATEVDLLDDAPRWAGSLSGATGTARSWMYDLGITSIYTAPEPLSLPAAEALGGNSVQLRGVATNGERTISFRAAIPVQQGAETEAGIPVVRKSPSEPFEHEVDLDEAGLWIAFDAAPWLAQVDFGSMVAPPVSQTNPNPVFVIEPGTQPYRALRNAVLSGERPAFRWSSPR